MVKITKWAVGAAMLACTGALVACGNAGGTASDAAVGSGTPSSAVRGTATGPAPATPSPTAPPAPAGAATPALSGTREVTIVRVQASEGGLALDGRLVEADDDSGRQLFVPTPLGRDTYLIKAYTRANNHPAADEASCWQVHDPRSTQSRTVEGAPCDPGNPAQRFTIIPNGTGTYAISTGSMYLWASPRNVETSPLRRSGDGSTTEVRCGVPGGRGPDRHRDRQADGAGGQGTGDQPGHAGELGR